MQHLELPPSSLLQPVPPHLPHEAAQQTRAGPGKPRSHQVRGKLGGKEGGGGAGAGMTQEVSSKVEHCLLDETMPDGQQAPAPPGRSPQLVPPHRPHERAQQTPQSPPRPQKPWSHHVVGGKGGSDGGTDGGGAVGDGGGGVGSGGGGEGDGGGGGGGLDGRGDGGGAGGESGSRQSVSS